VAPSQRFHEVLGASFDERQRSKQLSRSQMVIAVALVTRQHPASVKYHLAGERLPHRERATRYAKFFDGDGAALMAAYDEERAQRDAGGLA
jgi:hypothetical protein